MGQLESIAQASMKIKKNKVLENTLLQKLPFYQTRNLPPNISIAKFIQETRKELQIIEDNPDYKNCFGGVYAGRKYLIKIENTYFEIVSENDKVGENLADKIKQIANKLTNQ